MVAQQDAYGLTTAQVHEGTLSGEVRDGVRCFTGVPYAAPPVGGLRFRAPRPAPTWTGARDATVYGAPAYQVDLENMQRVREIAARLDPGFEGVPPFPPGFIGDTVVESSSEDCLYVDIYAPETAPGELLPVYVYYHGGANVTNSASGRFNYQRGEEVARTERVVVVQPQYRMGALGWVHLGLVDPGLPEAINLGLKDQVAALRWVTENIAAFGGNPAAITIGGESAGATAVSHLVTIPEVRRLARRAILQSLSPYNTWCTQLEREARAIAQTYVDVLGPDLAQADADELLALQGLMLRLFHPDTVVAWRPHGAVVDGELIGDLPVQRLAEEGLETAGDFEVMIGFAKDEWQFFRGHTPTMQETDRAGAVEVLSQVVGENAAAVFDAYAELYPDRAPAHLLSDVMSYIFFKGSSLQIARALDEQGIPVHVFQFSYDHPGLDGYLRALHTGTLPFVWRAAYDPERRVAFRSLDGADTVEIGELARDFGRLYGEFIRTGDPGDTWAPFTDKDEGVLWFGVPLESRRGLLAGETDAFGRAGGFDTRAIEDHLRDRLRQVLPDALARLRPGIGT